jgi:hypothetical protein
MPGPAPKELGTKAGRSPDKIPFRLVGLPEVEQPDLPESFRVLVEGVVKRVKYPPETRTWWAHWGDSILNDGFTTHDWDFLLDTARIHAMHHLGLDNKAAGELRQRLAKFGTTPEDRARLRIVTVTAENAEERAEEARKRNARIATIGDGRRLTSIEGFAS